MAPTRDKWVRRFVITETSRHKRGFTIYKVTSLVFLKSSPDLASKVSVWKRYNDFKKLHKTLSALHHRLPIKDPFPPFPKGKFFSRFETEVIKERRDCAIKLLEFIGRHQSLATNENFVKFFEISLQPDTSADLNESIDSDTSEDSQVSPASSHLTPLIPQKIAVLEKSPKPLEIERSRAEKSVKTIDYPQSEDYDQYVLIAAAHMSAGYRHESMNEHEEAFMQYKLGITNLLHGVEMDPDPLRQRKIHEKIKKYTERAETLYNRYLNSNISLLIKPSEELKNYKVIKVVNSVMLASDMRTNAERIIKTVEKVSGEPDDISNYILRGNVPFVVKLQGFVQTETTVFLILNYIRRGRLWESIKKRYGMEGNRVVRSRSCDGELFGGSGGRSYKEGDTKSNDDFGGNCGYKEDLPTIELLEKAQELLKSVDATIKKSNSIAERLNGRHLDPEGEDKSAEGSESELSSTESSSGSFEKIDISEVSNERDYDDCARTRIYSRGPEASEDSGVEMEQELWKIPENVVRMWTAQIIVALGFFHRQNVVVKGLRPQNLLVDDDDNVVLCYVVPVKTERFSVEFKIPYTAPELCNYLPDTEAGQAADVWSLGVILYELLTGMEFHTRHPGPFYSHSILSIPSDLSDNAKSLLKSILIFEASERLTIKEIKHHPFYNKIDWDALGDSNARAKIVKTEV
ncbi:ribosomal protein S6 kinase delta-1 [Fopius arisanus]|uniref:Ribosomal protein S6 kinase delta-1 n=1 Tax=Fopius arisanus TaxID=64838 RepID=A0A9R1TMG8_9HYME|nr:PREDICTED: ribosomal protein S6 kinase delta-1 [Fopius arisanus]